MLSDAVKCSTGSPQGWVLSPLLFVLYTNDCQSTDDSVIVSLLQDQEEGRGPVIDNFIGWCNNSCLQLNVSKTKEMLINFWKKSSCPKTHFHTVVETVSQYKYLGTILDEKLSFEANTDYICKKANQELFFLRKLSDF